MAGFFEPRGKVWHLGCVPRDFSFGTLPEDSDHVGPIFQRANKRVPALGECGLQLFFKEPEAFTPNGVYYLGETPELDGCCVAYGFNSVDIQTQCNGRSDNTNQREVSGSLPCANRSKPILLLPG